jgi:uncharacterized protein YlxW (UPF0749 family)
LVQSAVTALLGFGLVSLTLSTASARRADAPRRAQLVSLINQRKSQVTVLDHAVRGLRAEVDQAERAAGRLTTAAHDHAALLDRLALQSGTAAVTGPGLIVRLSDSTRSPSDLAQAAAYRIQDVDLQLIVNALFDAGAEAVAVNDNRLVATTPIRGAGQTIVVNFRPLTPPYEVKAIGASRARFESADIAKRFHRWTSLFGLGFSVRESGEVTVSAYSGRVSITVASPAVPGATGTAPGVTTPGSTTPGGTTPGGAAGGPP